MVAIRKACYMQFSSFFSYPAGEVAPPEDVLTFLPNRSDEDWALLLSYTETQLFQVGEVVINQGETDRGLYFLVEGRLEVLSLPARSRQWRHLADLGVGTVFGEQAFFDNRPRSALVRAVTDTTLLRLNPEDFEKLAGREPGLAQAILFDLGRILSLRLRQTSQANDE